MQAYQERVVTEKRELDEKLEKLSTFIKGGLDGVFSKLDIAEQDRMRRQLEAMTDYSDVLGERIAGFLPEGSL